MNPASLSSLANHLWQSTLFAAAAGLLTLALRTNPARVRHWVWLAASYKFLIPVSVLIALGGDIRWRTLPENTARNLSVIMDEVSRPFTAPALSSALPAVPPAASPFPAILLSIWACGFLGITCSWWVRWRRIQAAVRAGSPLQLAIPIRVMSSSTLLEPGVFGVFRPVLVLPGDIFGSLTPGQLQAVIEHELCHVRHRDNLIAAIHMFVEAVFWFHPLVWWIGKRLVEERERGCDEEVLQLGSEPRVYAEGILKICKLYVESPLVCVPGVTGSNLKARIESIMRNRPVVSLNLGKKLALAVAGMAALVVPIVVGILNAPAVRAQGVPDWQTAAGGKMAFEVASVKPSNAPKIPNFPLDARNAKASGGRFSAAFRLFAYILFAYKLEPWQLSAALEHVPKWVTTDFYEIEARAEGNPTKDQMRLMMQSLLADRFKLAVHFETREVPVFALSLVKPGQFGPRLRPHAEGPPCPDSFTEPDPHAPLNANDVFPPNCETAQMWVKPNGMSLVGSRNTTMPFLAAQVAAQIFSGGVAGEVDKPVVDKTGLDGRFDFTIEWLFESAVIAPNRVEPDLPGPAFLDAVREQLGLKLESTKGPVQFIVIDSVEKPSEN